MNEEQLDGVAGGTCLQTADDSRFLNVLLRGRPEQCGRYGAFKIFFGIGINKEIKNAWNSVGIKAYFFEGTINEYYIGGDYHTGKRITRDQAYKHAQEVIGKTLRRYDWDY